MKRLTITLVSALLLNFHISDPSFAKSPAGQKMASGSSATEKIALVEGFRSARFGMVEKEVRKAIKRDFGLSKAKIKRQVHPTEKTTGLTVKVKDILPESGPAQVAYVFGFKTKRLIQVNIIWGNPVDANPKADKLIATANSLRDYFARRGFKKDDLVMNARLQDGSILVFRGSDPKGRMVILLLNNPQNPPPAKDKKGGISQELSLRLSYIHNPRSPDIFQIKAGDF